MRIRLSVEGGGGRARPPWPMAGPRGQDCQAAPPPFGRQEASPGDQRPPPTPPPPLPHRPESGRGGGPPSPPPPPARTPAGEPQARPSAPPGPGGRPHPHRRAGATRTTEHEGGRAPHDPPITTAHFEGTEGGFAGQLGPPGERSTGRPSPPPTPGRHFSPDRTRAPEGSAPATRREPERGTAGRRPEREQGGRGATPPPRQGGWAPLNPRGEPECDPPPRSSRRRTWGPRRTSGPTPAHRDAAQIVPREAG